MFRKNSGEESSIYLSNSDLEQAFVANTGRLMGRLSYMDINPLPNKSIVSLTILREVVYHLSTGCLWLFFGIFSSQE